VFDDLEKGLAERGKKKKVGNPTLEKGNEASWGGADGGRVKKHIGLPRNYDDTVRSTG